MTHRDVRDRLGAYLDGDLTASARTAVDAHLEGCGECATLLGELRATLEHLRALPDPEPPIGLATRVMARVPEAPPLRASRWLPVGVAAAAAALLLVQAASRDSSAPVAGNDPPAAPATRAFGLDAPDGARPTPGSEPGRTRSSLGPQAIEREVERALSSPSAFAADWGARPADERERWLTAVVEIGRAHV